MVIFMERFQEKWMPLFRLGNVTNKTLMWIARGNRQRKTPRRSEGWRVNKLWEE
jgi:hypothetical protein